MMMINWTVVLCAFMICLTVMIWQLCMFTKEKMHIEAEMKWQEIKEKIKTDWEREKFLYLQEHRHELDEEVSDE